MSVANKMGGPNYIAGQNEWELFRYPDRDCSRLHYHDREFGGSTVIELTGPQDVHTSICLLLKAANARVTSG